LFLYYVHGAAGIELVHSLGDHTNVTLMDIGMIEKVSYEKRKKIKI